MLLSKDSKLYLKEQYIVINLREGGLSFFSGQLSRLASLMDNLFDRKTRGIYILQRGRWVTEKKGGHSFDLGLAWRDSNVVLLW